MLSPLRPLRFARFQQQPSEQQQPTQPDPFAGDRRLRSPGAGMSSQEARRVLRPDEDVLRVPEKLTSLKSTAANPDRYEENVPRELRQAGTEGLLSRSEVQQLSPREAERFVEHWNKTAPIAEHKAAAKLGAATADWHDRANLLVSIFGPDAPRFAAVLAGTSPRTNPTDNLRFALQFWNEYQALVAAVQAGDRARMPTRQQIKKLIRSWAEKGRVPRFEAYWGLVSHALSSPEPGKPDYGVLLNSEGKTAPKVDSFRQNQQLQLWPVTVDVWESKLGRFPQKEIGTFGGAYLSQVVKKRIAAARVNGELPPGFRLAPAQVMGATWSAIRALSYVAAVNDWTEPNKYTAEKLLATLTNGDMMRSKDFLRGLQRYERIQKQLRDMGYGQALDRLLSLADKNDQTGLGEARPYEQANLSEEDRRHLLNTAKTAIRHAPDWNAANIRQYAKQAKNSLATQLQHAALFSTANRLARPLNASTSTLLTAIQIGLDALQHMTKLRGHKQRFAAAAPRLRYSRSRRQMWNAIKRATSQGISYEDAITDP